MTDPDSTPADAPLDPEDARILSLESGPIRGHTIKVLLVEDAPGASAVPDLCAAIDANLAQVPRWRQRLVTAPGTPAGLAWHADPAFRVCDHVRAVHAEAAADDRALRGLVAETMQAPLDRSVPLWSLEVVPRLADGRWALVWKVHHCLADGMTVMAVGSRLIWTPQAPTTERAVGTARASAPARARAPGRAGQVKAGARLTKLVGYRGLAVREFRRIGPLSPLAAQVGSRREVAFATCTLGDLRALGKAIGPEVTVNDVLLATIAAALRRWLVHRGTPLTEMEMKVEIPVSMHPDPGAVEPCGNRDSFLFVGLPIGEGDPVVRVRTVAAATRKRKNRHDANAIYALGRALSDAPGPLRRRLQRVLQGPHEYSLNVSNVPGPAMPIAVLGRGVDEMYTLAEIAPRHALRVSAVSLAGSLFIGLCADPDAVPDLDVIAASIPRAVDELRDRLSADVPDVSTAASGRR